MERPDVLVVGASPAGLAATREAAKEGARVVLLEGREQIGTPPAPAVVAFDFLWTARMQLIASDVKRRLEVVRLCSPGGHALDVVAPLHVLDRTRFDARLASEAQQAGAHIVTDARDVARAEDGTITANGVTYAPAVTVFADGTDSLARTIVRPTRHADALTWGVAQRIRRPGAGAERAMTITVGSHAPHGRSQMTPYDDDTWLHWTFYRGDRDEAPRHARRALELDLRLRGWDPALAHAAEPLGVAPDPVYMLPGKLVADGVLVAGGAGGQGGLEMGLAAGELAGVTAARAAASGRTDVRALSEYERAWKRAHLAGYAALRRYARRVARLDDAAIDRVMAPWAGWRVPARDLVGLGHPTFARRVEALSKFVARNPHTIPTAAWVGLQALLPWR